MFMRCIARANSSESSIPKSKGLIKSKLVKAKKINVGLIMIQKWFCQILSREYFDVIVSAKNVENTMYTIFNVKRVYTVYIYVKT